MLKSTLSKIKKAWALALAARGRGDVRAIPGKFLKLSISGKPTDKRASRRDRSQQCERCKQIIDYIFSQNKTLYEIRKTSRMLLPANASLRSRTRTYELISQGFGVGGNDDNGIKIPMKDGRPPTTPVKDNRVQATTTPPAEELVQKIEEIDETPLVEAEKKKLGERNKAPRVLGHIAEVNIIDENNSLLYKNDCSKAINNEDKALVSLHQRDKIEALVKRIEGDQFPKHDNNSPPNEGKTQTLNFTTNEHAQSLKLGKTDNENSQFDEIAKRCLDSHTGCIDERLLKEMKSYGVPPSDSNNMDKEMFDITIMKKTKKPIDTIDVDLASTRSEHDLPSISAPELHPSLVHDLTLRNASGINVDATVHKKGAPELFQGAKGPPSTDNHLPTAGKFVVDTENEPRPKFNPLKPLIDPLDKRSLHYETDNFGYETLTITEPSQQQTPREETTRTEEAKPQAGQQHTPYPNPMSTPNQNFYPNYQNFMYYQNYNHARHWQKEHLKPHGKEANVEKKVKPGAIPEPSINPAQQAYSYFTSNEQVHDHPRFGGWQHNLYWPQQNVQQPNALPAEQSSIEQKPSTTSNIRPQKIIHPELISADLNPGADKNVAETPAISGSPITASPLSFENKTAPTTNADPITSSPFADDKPRSPVNPTHATICSLSQPQEVNETVLPKLDFNAYKEKLYYHLVAPKTNSIIDKEKLLQENDDTAKPKEMQKTKEANMDALPKLNDENLSLSEMLKRVRLRNRMQLYQSLESPLAKKCTPPPPCPPPAPECSPTPPPHTPPNLTPCPRPCTPKCPHPCVPASRTCPPQTPTCPPKKCMSTLARIHNFNMLTLFLCINPKVPHLRSSINIPESVITIYLDAGTPVESIVQYLKNNIQLKYRSKLELAIVDVQTDKTKTVALAREFEPWVPIPCWPIPKKQKKKKLVCPKDGCTEVPPPRLDDPCDKSGNPCLGFPKRSNSFALIDLLLTNLAVIFYIL